MSHANDGIVLLWKLVDGVIHLKSKRIISPPSKIALNLQTKLISFTQLATFHRSLQLVIFHSHKEKCHTMALETFFSYLFRYGNGTEKHLFSLRFHLICAISRK
jgi:hypothetical protein